MALFETFCGFVGCWSVLVSFLFSVLFEVCLSFRIFMSLVEFDSVIRSVFLYRVFLFDFSGSSQGVFDFPSRPSRSRRSSSEGSEGPESCTQIYLYICLYLLARLAQTYLLNVLRTQLILCFILSFAEARN